MFYARLISNKYLTYITYAGLLGFLLLLLCSIILDSLNHILQFNGYAANGAFQLMNPLTRLANGELVGRDFQFFHGPGVVLLHYPLFELFGRGLFGSEMSRWFTSVILFVVSGLVFSQLWFKKKGPIPHSVSIFATISVIIFTMQFTDVITPSNSLLGVRTTLPLLIGATLLIGSRLKSKQLIFSRFSLNLFHLVLGTLFALAVLCGTEHGIASIFAYTVIQFVLALKRRREHGLVRGVLDTINDTLPIFGVTLVSLLVLASIISLGNPVDMLRYNLVTVPMEQFWYFGAEPQGFLQLASLAKQLRDPSIVPFYYLVAMSIILIITAEKLSLLSYSQKISMYFLFAYGIFTLGSLLGYYTPVMQLAGIIRMLVLIDTLIIIIILARLLSANRRTHVTIAIITIMVILANTLSLSVNKINLHPVMPVLRDTYQNLKGDHTALLGSQWQNRIAKFRPYIDEAQKDDNDYILWSTYSSLYEQSAGIIHPSSSGCDYIIHCLGDSMQAQYVKDFVDYKPTLVTTLRPSYFGFEEWLWARQADFYRELVNNYDIIASNDAHLLWKRRVQVSEPSQTTATLVINGNRIELPSMRESGSRVIEVSVTYETDEHLSGMPGLSKLPRYLLKPSGTHSTVAISLPPTKSEWKFIVVLNADLAIPQKLDAIAAGLLPATIKIESASYSPLYINSYQSSYFTEQSILQVAHR